VNAHGIGETIPAVTNAAAPAHRTPPPELRPVVTLLLVNLALSALLAILLVVFHTSLVDYQISRMNPPPGTDLEGLRTGLTASLWSRVATVAVIAVVYTFIIRSLRRGRRRSWIRIMILSVVSLAAIVYLIVSGQYPVWVRVEQIVQAVVLVALLWAATRPAVRAHFPKAAAATA
jgi:hypothetical protein